MWRKGTHSYAAGGNVNWCSHYGEQYGGFSKELKIELPYDPAIPHTHRQIIILKDTCIPRFTAALFTIAKTQKQPKCPSTNEWKEEWNNTVCRNTMNLEIIMLSEVSQTEKDKCHMISLISRIKKMIQVNLFTKQK